MTNSDNFDLNKKYIGEIAAAFGQDQNSGAPYRFLDRKMDISYYRYL